MTFFDDDWLIKDEEEDEYNPVTQLALGNPTQAETRPPMEVAPPEPPPLPKPKTDFFETSTPSTSSSSVLDDIWSGNTPPKPTAPKSQWNTPPALEVKGDTEYAQYIQGLRDQGLWGDQYGAPVGGGQVIIGGGGKAPTPSYITGQQTTTTPGVAGRSATSGATSTNERQTVTKIGEVARASGLDDEGARILQSVATVEGGMTGKVGDNGNSFGIYQFHMRGELPAFAKWAGVSIEEAKVLANNPEIATKFASETYLGAAIKAGRAQGLSGAELATYVQRHGQRSEAPEKTGAAYQEWFGSGQDPFRQKTPDQGQMDAGVASQTPPPAPRVSTLKGITPSQLDLQANDPDYLALCGPVAATAFANAAGIKLNVSDAKKAALEGGWWDANNGMHGPAAATKLINSLGVKASYKEGVDWQLVASNVQGGKPVILNAMTTGGKIGHYFVVEDYDPSTGKFYLGNSLLTLNKNAHGGNAWVTPEELAAMQSRTQINVGVSGMILMDQPSVAQPAQGAARPAPTSTQPTTQTTVTSTQGAPGSAPTPIQANVGNRPLTIYDLAMGTIAPSAAPVAPPPPVQIQQAPTATPAGALPAWRAQNAAAVPKAETDAFEAEKKEALEYGSQVEKYVQSINETNKKNIVLAEQGAKDWQTQFQSGNTPVAMDDGSMNVPLPVPDMEAQYSPAALNAYEDPPKPKATPRLDAAIAKENKKRMDEWVAEGSDPNTKPQPIYTPKEQYDLIMDMRRKAEESEQKFATDYFNMSETQREAAKAEIERQRGVARAAAYAPTNEYQSLMEANAPGPGDASISITTPTPEYVVPPDMPTVTEVTAPSTTRVISRTDEIDALPVFDPDTASPEEWAAAGLTPPRTYDQYDADAATGTGAPRLPGMGDEKREAVGSPQWEARQKFLREREARARAAGYVTQAEKDQMYADLATGKAVSASDYQEREQQNRMNPYLSPEAIKSVVEAKYGKPIAELTSKEISAAISEYNGINNPSYSPDVSRWDNNFFGSVDPRVYEDGYTGDPNAGQASQAWAGWRRSVGSGLAAAGGLVNIPSLEAFGAQLWERGANEQRQNQVDPRSLSTLEQAVVSAPSVITSIGVGIVASLAASAVGAGGAVGAGITIGASAISSIIQEGGGAYDEALTSGATKEQASAAFLINGSAASAIESTPWGRLLARTPGGKAIINRMAGAYARLGSDRLANTLASSTGGRMLTAVGRDITPQIMANAFSEGLQEGVQEAISIATESVYKDRDFQATMAELQERFPDIWQAAKVGALMGAVTEAPGNIAANINPVLGRGFGTEATMLNPEVNIDPPPFFPVQAVPNNTSPSGTLPTAPSGPQAVPNPTPNAPAPTGTVPVPPTQAAPVATTPDPMVMPQQPLITTNLDENNNAVINQANLLPGWQAEFDSNSNVEPAIWQGTATPAQRMAGAISNLGIMTGRTQQAASRGLNPDERSFVLDELGVEDQNMRHIAAIANAHLESNPGDNVVLQQTIAKMYANPASQPTIEQFLSEFNTAKSKAAPKAPRAAGGGRTAAPATPAAPADVSTAPNAVPARFVKTDTSGQRVAEGSQIISSKAVKGNFMGSVRDAFEAEGDLDGYAEVRGELKKIRQGTKGDLTVRDVYEALNVVEARDPEQADRIRQRLGVDAITVNGNTRPVRVQPAGAPAPTTGRSRKSGLNPKLQGPSRPTAQPIASDATSVDSSAPVGTTPVTVPEAPQQAPMAPPGANRGMSDDLPAGQLRVYLPVHGNNPFKAVSDYSNSTTINTPGGRVRVVSDPSEVVNEGQELMQSVPLIVNEADVVQEADGSLSLVSNAADYTTIAQGRNAARAQEDTTEESARLKANEAVENKPSLEAVENIDRFGSLPITNGAGVINFQKDELSSQDRQNIADSEAIATISKSLDAAVGEVYNIMKKVFPDLPRINYQGLTWMPTIIGVKMGTKEPFSVEFNPFAAYRYSVEWARINGVSINSDAFRRHLSGTLVSTMVHEMAHTLPKSGTDSGGHGGSHDTQIYDTFNQQGEALQAAIQTVYRSLNPTNTRELGQITQQVHDSVGVPVDEDVAVDSESDSQVDEEEDVVSETEDIEPEVIDAAPEAQPSGLVPTGNPDGLSLLDGDTEAGIGRKFGHWNPAIVSMVGTVAADGNSPAPKNLSKRDLKDMQERGERQTAAQNKLKELTKIMANRNGHKPQRLIDTFQALFEMDKTYPGMSARVAERMRLNGFTYTDGDGKTQSVVFPHKLGDNNGLQRTTESGTSLRVATLSNEGRERGVTNESSGVASGGTNQQPRKPRGPSPIIQPGNARLPGTLGDDGRIGYIPPERGSGYNWITGRSEQAQPVDTRAEPSSYIPGTNVRNPDGSVRNIEPTRPPKVYKSKTSGEFWSPSRGQYFKFDSFEERNQMQLLEDQMTESSDPRGRVVEWVSEKDFDGNPMSLPYVDEIKNRYASYNPDFLVMYEDGSIEIIEVKRNDALALEDAYRNTEGGEKIRKGWNILKKLNAIVADSPFIVPGKKVTYKTISSADPSITERKMPEGEQKFLDFYTDANALSEIPYREDLASIADPVERRASTFAAVRQAMLKLVDKHLQPRTGRTRNARTVSFIANPADLTTSTTEVNTAMPGSREIIEQHQQQYGVQVTNATVGDVLNNAGQSVVLEATGDIIAIEKMSAEISRENNTANNAGNYVFVEDSKGRHLVHKMTIPAVDDALASALANVQRNDGPTITVVPQEDGTTDVYLSSRTPDGRSLLEPVFMEDRDNLVDALAELGATPTTQETMRGEVTHFADPIERNVDYAIGRRQELLGELPLGAYFDKTPPEGRISVGSRERETPQYEAPRQSNDSSEQIPDLGSEGPTLNERIREVIRENPQVTRADLRKMGMPTSEQNLKTQKNFVAREDTNVEGMAAYAPPMDMPDFSAFAAAQAAPAPNPNIDVARDVVESAMSGAELRQANPPGAATPNPRGIPQVPGLDLKKFSKEAQGAIRASAIAIMATGGPPATIRKDAADQLDMSIADFNKSSASTLSDIELAAVLRNLENARTQIHNTAHHFKNSTSAPTREELRDFIQMGMRYEAMHAQLTGSSERVHEASRKYTQAKQNTAKGETADAHVTRLLHHARTQPDKAANFSKEFLTAFANMNAMGASSYQMAKAWNRVLDPATGAGDWVLGFMYSAMLGPRTAAVALVGNTTEVFWRGFRDVLVTPFQYGGESGAKILNKELQGFLYGIVRGVMAFYETIRYGATKRAIAMGDVPINRLQNNQLGNPRLNKVANMGGVFLETFWGRFFQGADAFAKTWAYSMQLGREAAIASMALSANGKVDTAIADNLFNNPTNEMMKKAHRVELETAFQGDMDSIGEHLAQMQNWPGIGRILFPFLRTIYHSANRAVDRTPIGMVLTMVDAMRTAPGTNSLEKMKNIKQSDYWHGKDNVKLKGIRPMGERLIDSMFGSAAFGGIMYGVASGLIELTGQPPDDEKDRYEWDQKGNITYGVRIPAYSSKMLSYANWGPMTPVLAIIAENEARRKREGTIPPVESIIIAGTNMAKAAVDLSYLSNVAAFMVAASGGSKDAAPASSAGFRFFEDQVGTRIGFGATTMGIAQAQDPYVRYPDSKDPIKNIEQTIEARMPLHMPFSETFMGKGQELRIKFGGVNLARADLHPQLDIWGFPIVNPYYGYTAPVNPFRVVDDRSDGVDKELFRLNEAGVDVRPTKPSTTYEGYKFTEEELFEWKRRVGQDSHARLSYLFAQPEYQAAPASGEAQVTKQKLIESQYTAAKETAWESMAITPPVADPGREPKFYGLEEEASRRGVPWWELEKRVEKANKKWNDYRDALKTGRQPPQLTEDEMALAGQFANASNRGLNRQNQEAATGVKKVTEGYPGIPFNALP